MNARCNAYGRWPLLLAALAVSGCATVATVDGGRDGVAPAGPPVASNERADVQTELGLGYMKEGRLDLAFDHLRNAIHLDPNYSTAHVALALFYEKVDELQSARKHFERAVQVERSDSAAHNNYGRFLCRMGEHEDGLKHVETALANPLYRKRTVALVNAGQCARGSGENDRAEAYLREALQRDPSSPRALLAMSELSFERNNFLSARAYLQRYAARSPLPAKHLLIGYRTEQALGDSVAASDYARRLLDSFPDAEETAALEREVI